MVYAKFLRKRPPYMVFWFFKNHKIWRLNKIGESPVQLNDLRRPQVGAVLLFYWKGNGIDPDLSFDRLSFHLYWHATTIFEFSIIAPFWWSGLDFWPYCIDFREKYHFTLLSNAQHPSHKYLTRQVIDFWGKWLILKQNSRLLWEKKDGYRFLPH